jgi:tetratricopeptide (TPR) repeat protein
MDSSQISIEKSYELFGVNRSTSIDEIKAIYRRMAKEIHPDLHPDDLMARDRFHQLNQAYQLLLAAADDRKNSASSESASSNSVRIDRVVEPILSPQDLQLKQEIFASLEKLIRQGDFIKAVATIDLLVKVIPNSTEISKKQSEVYFQYAQELVKQRQQFNLARIYLKQSLKLDPRNQKRWEAVNREFNRIERFTQ